MFIRDAQQAFRDAIGNADLTHETAGEWMYMYSERDGDWFKNITTREYVKFEGEILEYTGTEIWIK